MPKVMFFRWLFALCALALGFLRTGAAEASPSFPGEVQRHLDMPCVPQCTLCHRDTNGGIGTVIQPFGEAMRAVGLKAKHPELIGPALDALERSGIDSDGDGQPDIQELREGSNPNQGGGGVLCATYGCSTPPSAPATSGAVAVMVLLMTTGSLTARARRRRRTSSPNGAAR